MLPEGAAESDLLAATRRHAESAAERDLDRDALWEALRPGLDELDAPPPAHASLDRLRTERAVVVVAGQQPGLLGGPGLSLGKGLAAAATARVLSSEGIPAVPVYWHASEDHDHGEADHVGWTRGGSVERLRVALPEDRRMLSRVPVPPAVRPLVEQVSAELAETPGADTSWLRGLLQPAPGDSFGRWTGRIVAGLLGRLGVIVVEPHRLRAVAHRVVETDRARPRALRAAVEGALDRITGAGAPPPLALRRDEQHFVVDTAGRRLPPAAAGDAPRDPGATSWNVVSRVLAQNVALPVAVQMVGPGELGYLAALGGAHRELGVPFALPRLRPGLTPLSRAAARAARALDVDPRDVVRDGTAVLDAPAATPVHELERARTALEALPDGAAQATARRRRDLLRRLGDYEAALRRDLRDRDETRARRVRVLATACRPGGRPAERVLSPLPWIAREGPAGLERVVGAFAAAERAYRGQARHLVLPLG